MLTQKKSARTVEKYSKLMTDEEQKQLGVLVRYPEFAVLQKVLTEKSDELMDLRRGMPSLSSISSDAQIVGRTWAWSFVSGLLEEMKIWSRDTVTKENTTFN